MGKERDDETGLYYYGARYYASWLARFVSVDPLKDDYPFFTSYQYAGNKPIIGIDLDGLESTAEIGQEKSVKQDNTSVNSYKEKVKILEFNINQENQRLEDLKNAQTFEEYLEAKFRHEEPLVLPREELDLPVGNIYRDDAFSDFDRAAQLGTEIAGAVEGVYALKKLPKIYKYLKNYYKSLDEVTEGIGDIKKAADGTLENPSQLVDDYAGVEITNVADEPLGEFDAIDMLNKAFIEDKSARGIYTLNPKTKLPAQTPHEWAYKNIFKKSVVRINNLLDNAVATRPTSLGSQLVPQLDEIKDFQTLVFRIDSTDPAVIAAVEDEMKYLSYLFPNWTFKATFGKP